MTFSGVRSICASTLGVRANPTAIYQLDRYLRLCRSVKKAQEHSHPAFCVWRLLDNSSQAVKRAAINTDLLTDSQVRTRRNEPFRICLFHQIINDIVVNRRWSPIKTYDPFNPRGPNGITIFRRINVDSGEKIVWKQRNNPLTFLAIIIRKKQLGQKNLKSLCAQLRLRDFFFLRLAVNCIPLPFGRMLGHAYSSRKLFVSASTQTKCQK
jgi:hypothetical protein